MSTYTIYKELAAKERKEAERLRVINKDLLEALDRLVATSITTLGRIEPNLRAHLIAEVDIARAAIRKARES